jgi:hypothetical protein
MEQTQLDLVQDVGVVQGDFASLLKFEAKGKLETAIKSEMVQRKQDYGTRVNNSGSGY